MTYFNTDVSNGIGDTVRIDEKWQLKDKRRSDQLLYAPYIAIIPADTGWVYVGSHQNIPPLNGVRTSIKNEIIKRVLKNDPSYNWENINTIGIYTRAKSFAQGFVTFAFKKTGLRAKDRPQFRIYLIYCDPVRKTGWYQVLDQEANLIGFPPIQDIRELLRGYRVIGKLPNRTSTILGRRGHNI